MDVSPRQNPAYRLSLRFPLPTTSHRFWIGSLVLYAAAIFALSHTPVRLGPPPFAHFDKLLHAAEFGLFAVLAWKATRGRRLASFLLTATYAGIDEIHQLLVTARTASSLDFAADLVGALLALLLVTAAGRLWRAARTRRILRLVHRRGGS